VEQQLNLIAAGKADFDAVLQHGINIFHLKFKYFVLNIGGMDELFEVSFSPLSASGKAMSRSPHSLSVDSVLFFTRYVYCPLTGCKDFSLRRSRTGKSCIQDKIKCYISPCITNTFLFVN